MEWSKPDLSSSFRSWRTSNLFLGSEQLILMEKRFLLSLGMLAVSQCVWHWSCLEKFHWKSGKPQEYTEPIRFLCSAAKTPDATEVWAKEANDSSISSGFFKSRTICSLSRISSRFPMQFKSCLAHSFCGRYLLWVLEINNQAEFSRLTNLCILASFKVLLLLHTSSVLNTAVKNKIYICRRSFYRECSFCKIFMYSVTNVLGWLFQTVNLPRRSRSNALPIL